MLVWHEVAGRYDAAATPSTGRDTLAEHHARLIHGDGAIADGEPAAR
jgi:divinyl chlorophyllide a 8-vinyl-reductase